MPIDSVQQLLHLRTRKNKQIMASVDRLWALGRSAQHSDDILQGLHPWGSNTQLFFHNGIPKFLVTLAIIFIVFSLFPIFDTLKWMAYSSAAILILIAYIIYEPNKPIHEVIAFLEERMIGFKFGIEAYSTPSHLGTNRHNTLIISQLRQKFPLFNQGNHANDILKFASTTWKNAQNQDFPVMLFHYRFIDEVNLPEQNKTPQKLKKIERHRWGVFVFDISPLGLATTSRKKGFTTPYTERWESSDLELRKKVQIYGTDRLQLAKIMTPSTTLKLIKFYRIHQGDLIFHPHDQIMCYLGDRDLFDVTHKLEIKEIKNISALRGYLRTLTMPNYQQLKQSMLNLVA
ncbi:hypothetical protein [Acinetobacter sp. Ver3]|uniref:hypothetical protein n=1 Tax=Acinetobacter sp. Ver3 TaxID=466088 RepID=UPI00044FC452|nr:hypothetical protein [Acinetobacter sp. Ver3]EZQ11592.1 membrane protein [Acinetobacter sp. Ver3]